jgi:hypothetical protein
MLHDIYLHEMLARAAANPGKHEIANQRALAELPRPPRLSQQFARRGGWLLIRAGVWLFAYGAGRDGRLRLSDLQPHPTATTFSQN